MERFTVHLSNRKKINNKLTNTLSFKLSHTHTIKNNGKITVMDPMMQAQEILSSLKEKGYRIASINRKGKPMTGFYFSGTK